MDHALDPGQGFQKAVHSHVDPGAVDLAQQKGREEQGQQAVCGVDADLRFGPMEPWTRAYEVRVLHLPEGVLDLDLAPVGGDDLLVGPVGAVGKEQGFAQVHVDQGIHGRDPVIHPLERLPRLACDRK